MPSRASKMKGTQETRKKQSLEDGGIKKQTPEGVSLHGSWDEIHAFLPSLFSCIPPHTFWVPFIKLCALFCSLTLLTVGLSPSIVCIFFPPLVLKLLVFQDSPQTSTILENFPLGPLVKQSNGPFQLSQFSGSFWLKLVSGVLQMKANLISNSAKSIQVIQDKSTEIVTEFMVLKCSVKYLTYINT